MRKFTDRWGESHEVEVVKAGGSNIVKVDGIEIRDDLPDEDVEFVIEDIKYFADLVRPS